MTASRSRTLPWCTNTASRQTNSFLMIRFRKDVNLRTSAGKDTGSGDYHVSQDSNIQPVQHAPRKVPVAIKTKVKDHTCCMISCGFLRFGWERCDENGNRWLWIGAGGHGAESVWLIWHWCLNFICQAPFIQCVRRVDADEKKRTANSTTKVVKKGRLFKVVLWVKCHLSDFYLNHVII